MYIANTDNIQVRNIHFSNKVEAEKYKLKQETTKRSKYMQAPEIRTSKLANQYIPKASEISGDFNKPINYKNIAVQSDSIDKATKRKLLKFVHPIGQLNSTDQDTLNKNYQEDNVLLADELNLRELEQLKIKSIHEFVTQSGLTLFSILVAEDTIYITFRNMPMHASFLSLNNYGTTNFKNSIQAFINLEPISNMSHEHGNKINNLTLEEIVEYALTLYPMHGYNDISKSVNRGEVAYQALADIIDKDCKNITEMNSIVGFIMDYIVQIFMQQDIAVFNKIKKIKIIGHGRYAAIANHMARVLTDPKFKTLQTDDNYQKFWDKLDNKKLSPENKVRNTFATLLQELNINCICSSMNGILDHHITDEDLNRCKNLILYRAHTIPSFIINLSRLQAKNKQDITTYLMPYQDNNDVLPYISTLMSKEQNKKLKKIIKAIYLERIYKASHKLDKVKDLSLIQQVENIISQDPSPKGQIIKKIILKQPDYNIKTAEWMV